MLARAIALPGALLGFLIFWTTLPLSLGGRAPGFCFSPLELLDVKTGGPGTMGYPILMLRLYGKSHSNDG